MPDAPGAVVLLVDFRVDSISYTVTWTGFRVVRVGEDRSYGKFSCSGEGDENHAACIILVFSRGVTAVSFVVGSVRTGEKCLRMPLYQLLSCHTLVGVTVSAKLAAPSFFAVLIVSFMCF